MTEQTANMSQDQYLEKMKAARDRTAVLKTTLAEIRSGAPKSFVFAFEGVDDKIVYSRWLSRIRPDINYEPLPCNSKRNVLRLRELCKKDRTNIGVGVFYFVDRDFDDLEGFGGDSNTFMTDRYSVENYLISQAILGDIITNEFHCHAKLNVRRRICELFDTVYDSFLNLLRPVNERIFLARRLKIGIVPAIPDKIGKIAVIQLAAVSMVASAEQLIVLDQEPDPNSLSVLIDEFSNLDPKKRYRGKFALRFLLKWLELLAEEYSFRRTGIFDGVDKAYNVRVSEISLGALAARSDLPLGLRAFLHNVKPEPEMAGH